jgi:hypothetical protein
LLIIFLGGRSALGARPSALLIRRPAHIHGHGHRTRSRCFATALRQRLAGDRSTRRAELDHSESLRPLIGRIRRYPLGRRIRRARRHHDIDRRIGRVPAVAERRGKVGQNLKEDWFRNAVVPTPTPRFEQIKPPITSKANEYPAGHPLAYSSSGRAVRAPALARARRVRRASPPRLSDCRPVRLPAAIPSRHSAFQYCYPQ